MRRPTDTEHRQPTRTRHASFAHAQGQLSTDAAARSRSQWKVTWRPMSPPSWLAALLLRSCLTCRFDLCPKRTPASACASIPSPQLRFNDLLHGRSGQPRTHSGRAARADRSHGELPYGSPLASRGARSDPTAGPGCQARARGAAEARWHGHVGAAGEPARGAPPGAGHVGQAEYTFPCSGPRNLCSEAGTIRPPTPAAPAIVPAGRVCD